MGARYRYGSAMVALSRYGSAIYRYCSATVALRSTTQVSVHVSSPLRCQPGALQTTKTNKNLQFFVGFAMSARWPQGVILGAFGVPKRSQNEPNGAQAAPR